MHVNEMEIELHSTKIGTHQRMIVFLVYPPCAFQRLLVACTSGLSLALC